MNDVKRLLAEATPPSAWRGSREPADAWMDGYTACWNRMKEAGRLLPSDGPKLPDYEAAVEALEHLHKVYGFQWDGLTQDMVAAALARLREHQKVLG